jgi:ArsR family metal-binding transcriptional regulator
MVVITQVKDTEEGLELLKALTDAINATWEKRADLTAAFVVRHAPGWLDIWRLLPQTNCKECGEATCMAFAAALLKQTRRVDECAPLSADPTFVDRRVTLDTMV